MRGIAGAGATPLDAFTVPTGSLAVPPTPPNW
jgi:hypothetical protein